MKSSDYISAIEIMASALAEFGPHVRLLVDLASCYYMIADYPSFHRATFHAFAEFNQAHATISKDSLLSAGLGLGKLLEELGLISNSLTVFSLINSNDLSNPNYYKLLGQQLRLFHFAGNKKKVSEIYAYCESTNQKNLDSEIDLQLALILIDIDRVGIDAAQCRMNHLFHRGIHKEDDKRLIYFDFVFEVARRKETRRLDIKFLENFSYEKCDDYEQLLWDVFLTDLGKSPNKPLSLLRTDGLPLLASLRVLHLLSQRIETNRSFSEAQAKFMLLVNSVDPVSRQWILAAWYQNPIVDLNLHFSDKKIVLNGRVLDLERQPQALHLMTLFKKAKSHPTEALIRSLFGLDFSDSSYNRLKVLASKLNRRLEVLSGTLRPIKVTKTSTVFQLGFLSE